MKRNLLLSLVLLVTGYSLMYGQKLTRAQYIEKYKDLAIETMHSHGIPASITLAQACLESSDGNSDLARTANNHFGIKCHSDWTGKKFYKKDDDHGKSCFRHYSRVLDSYKDHSDFLRYRERYESLFDLDITDYKGWAHGLKKAGYATDPAYAQKLITIIEDYRLFQYDSPAVLPPSPSLLMQVEEYIPASTSPLYKYSALRTIYTKNGIPYIVASECDSYESIAKEYNLFTCELLSFNDLRKSQPIETGTVVYLRVKKNSAPKYLDVHIAEDGETYYSISQKYGIKLKKLLKYNNQTLKNNKLREGDTVYLRKR